MALFGSSIREDAEKEKYDGGFTVGSAMQEDLEEEAKKLKDGSILHLHSPWNEDDE